MATRRNFLALLSWTASFPIISSFLAAGQSSASGLSTSGRDAVSYFRDLGYTEINPLDLITGDDFNDGVRFDDSRPDGLPDGKSVVLQNCIRMEDVNDHDRPDVLPYFHILNLNVNEPYPRGAVLRETLEFLINQVNLDTDRLVFVSTDVFIPYLPIFI